MSRPASVARRAALPLAAAAVGVAVLLGELPDSGSGDPRSDPAPPASLPRDASRSDFCEAFRYFTAAHLDQLNNPDRPDATGLEQAAAALLRTGVPADAPADAAEGMLVVVEDTLAPYRTGSAGSSGATEDSPDRNRRAGRFNTYADRTCPDAF